MPRNAPKAPPKTRVTCPHCGGSQSESPAAQSTFCRHCGGHFDIGRERAAGEPKARVVLRDRESAREGPDGGTAPASAARRLAGGLLGRDAPRALVCHACGAESEASPSARSSLCPRCSAYINLEDIRVQGVVGRAVFTQGRLRIDADGTLTSSKAFAGEALIEGGLDGHLRCVRDVTLRRRGTIRGGIHARDIEVARKADATVLGGLRARNIEVKGSVRADIVATGHVVVGSHGRLIGAVRARSFRVEKGGLFEGTLEIRAAAADGPDPAAD